jgi:hypothetical protein
MERVQVALEGPRGGDLFLARKWIEGHFDEISREYSGRTIALRGEAIVAAADSAESIRHELASRQIRPDDCVLVTVLGNEALVAGTQ